MKTLLLLLSAMGLALLTGCSTQERVVLLPEADGRASAVTVQTGTGKVQIDKPYDAAVVRASGDLLPVKYSAEEVRKRYPGLVDAKLQPEKRFTLYFETGGAALTAESADQLPEIIRDLNARAGGELLIVGHTDRVGTNEANDRLSLVRADAVAKLFEERGVKLNRIETAGRGKREPLVPTDDEVAEPKNRRVEIRVR